MSDSDLNWKVMYSNYYTILLLALELEKIKHPETYESAVRIGEKIRKSIIRTGIFTEKELEPIPRLDENTEK